MCIYAGAQKDCNDTYAGAQEDCNSDRWKDWILNQSLWYYVNEDLRYCSKKYVVYNVVVLFEEVSF